MQAQQLETTDIFKSAVFLCTGGRLAGMRFKQRNQGIVSFLIEGEGLLALDLGEKTGRENRDILCSLCQVRSEIYYMLIIQLVMIHSICNTHPTC